MSTIEIKVPEDNQEGTQMKVQNWLVAIGDFVAKDAPLVEMETDKVTMEIEAPEDGYLSEIYVKPGSDVKAGEVLAKLSLKAPIGAASSAGESSVAASRAVDDVHALKTSIDTTDSLKKETLPRIESHEGRLSPAVRRYVSEHSIDISGLSGTGRGGRLTLKDVLTAPSSSSQNPTHIATVKTATTLIDRDVPHSTMRRAIADHMSHSVAIAPHVTAIFEMDFTAIAAHRAAHKQSFADQGVKLTYTAYFIQACVAAMQAVPEVNSRWHDDHLQLFGDVNIGIGTSLGDKGLVVPVVHSSQNKDLFETAKALQSMTEKARTNKLKPADVRGGTFTISNHGVSGSLVATPIIINQPQSAILGIGKLEKRVVVETIKGNDAMIIKPMAFVSLTIDHRVLDGHQTNAWLSAFIERVENWPRDTE